MLQAMQHGQGVVIDLDFEGQMTEAEIKSLCGQLQYLYASNTRAAVPCHLYLASLQVNLAKNDAALLNGLIVQAACALKDADIAF